MDDTAKGIYARLIALQAEIENPPLDGAATINSPKGNREYKYSTLPRALAYLRGVCAKHGLAIVQDVHASTTDAGECMVSVVTVLADASGNKLELGSIEALVPSNAVNPIQALGSVITYLRRYSLMSALGVAGDEDTDAAELSEDAGKNTGSRGKSLEEQKKDEADKKALVNARLDAWLKTVNLEPEQLTKIINVIKAKPAQEASDFLDACIRRYAEKVAKEASDSNEIKQDEQLF